MATLIAKIVYGERSIDDNGESIWVGDTYSSEIRVDTLNDLNIEESTRMFKKALEKIQADIMRSK